MAFGNNGFDSNGFDDDGFDSSGFDDFDDFGSDDMLDFGSGNQQSNTGNRNNGANSFDDFDAGAPQGNSIPGDAIDGLYDDPVQADANSSDSSNLKKTAIIAIIVGVVVVLGAIFIGSRVLNKDDKPKYDNSQVTVVDDNYTQQQNQTQQPVNNDASNIINGGVNAPSQGNSHTTVNPNTHQIQNNTDGWTELSADSLSNSTVLFEDSYKELIFTVTEINHYAKKTDNYLVMETRLKGSLSGISGTYDLVLPYNKGMHILEGNEIKVYVLFGNYNGNKVVGDISWR